MPESFYTLKGVSHWVIKISPSVKSHFAHLKDNGPALLNDAHLVKPGSAAGTLPEPIDELVGPATPTASDK